MDNSHLNDSSMKEIDNTAHRLKMIAREFDVCSMKEIDNKAHRLQRTARGFDLGEDKIYCLENFRSSLIDTAYDVSFLRDEIRHNKILDILNDIDIISVLRTYRDRCVDNDSKHIVMQFLECIFFECINHYKRSKGTTDKEYVKREDPDRKYYNLILILTEIYDEITKIILEPESTHPNENSKEIFLRTDHYDIIRDWLNRNRSTIKSSQRTSML